MKLVDEVSDVKCEKCGTIRKNKAAKDDNMDLIIKLSSNPI